MDSILIVEDDPTLLKVLRDNFELGEMQVSTAGDGAQGLALALDLRPDLIVLDIMLPKLNGYEVCRQIREQDLDVPIIMLTAKGEESEIILGLNLGADDYVTKPFSVRELRARVDAFLRRKHAHKNRYYSLGDCKFDRDACRLERRGKEVALTPKEHDLLELFLDNPGRALTREQILNAVWGSRVYVNARSVDRCVTTLRGKIEPDPSAPSLIKTLQNIGYRFDLDASPTTGRR